MARKHWILIGSVALTALAVGCTDIDVPDSMELDSSIEMNTGGRGSDGAVDSGAGSGGSAGSGGNAGSSGNAGSGGDTASVTTGMDSGVDAGGGGTECDPGAAALELCDGIDNDCDELIDEQLTRPCGTDVGSCESGTEACEDGVWGACTGGVEPVDEICDGVDNNCDSTIDEQCPCSAGQTEACGPDTNEGECQQGIKMCSDGVWASCEGEQEPAAIDSCNGLDDDCDAATDEGATCPGSQHCVEGQCRACGDDDHCTATPPTCQEYYCHTASYTCMLRPAPAAPRTSCSGSFGAGVCDGTSCVQCVSDNDCDGDRPYCDDDNACRPCDGGCELGDECEEDDDCESGTCDPSANICTGACSGSFTISNTASLNAVKGCTTVSGTITISENYAGGLTLPVLRSAGGISAECMNRPGLQSLTVPRLESIGGNVTITACAGLTALRFPVLETVAGSVFIANHLVLADFDFDEVTDINGQLMVAYLPRVAFPKTLPLWMAAELSMSNGTSIGCELPALTDCLSCLNRSCTPDFDP